MIRRPTVSSSTTAFTVTHGWDENRITYDANGNIMTVYRNDATQGSGNHTTIDNLTYTYSTGNPNQLQSVADISGSSAGFVGGSGNYTYDANGNLTAEPYKGITKITYDVLNRTDSIKLSATQYITYTYDAEGSLIRKQAYKSGATTQVTDYIDGFNYVNGTISYFPMPEGRVLNNGSGTLKQEFIITDQQGNARLSFQDNGSGGTKVEQENSYYAFGLIMPGTTVSLPSTPNKQLYNGGSEWQNDYSNLPDYYQTFNRNYDAAIGRFVGVDPIAESAESMTGYQYAGNNPIMFNDPMGDLIKYIPTQAPLTHAPQIVSNLTPSTGPLDGSWQDGANFGGPPPGFVDSPDDGESGGGGGGIAGNYNAFWTRFFTSGESFSDYVAENGTGTTYQFGIAGNLEYVGPSYSNTDNYTQKSLFGSEVLDDGFGNKISILTYGYEHISADHADILLGSSTQGDGEANRGVNEGNEIPEGYSKAFDATAFATDFHGVSLTAATTFLKDVGEPVLKYNRGVGAVGAVASLATVGVHLYNHQATWKDGVSGTLGVANLVLIAIPGIGEAVAGLELTVAIGTLAWDAYNQYEDPNQHK